MERPEGDCGGQGENPFSAIPWGSWLSSTHALLPVCLAGVCALFGLCGYFAATELLSKLAASSSAGRPWTSFRVVMGYYVRRFLRLVPLHWCAIFLTWVVFTRHYATSDPEPVSQFWHSARDFWWSRGSCPSDGSWMLHNLAFLNNYQTFGGCYAVTWSNAAQVQFYVIFPLVLLALRPQTAGFRRRICITAAVVVLLNILLKMCAYEYIPSVSLPVAIFGAVGSEAGEGSMTDMISNYGETYFSTHARMGQFAVGVILAVAHRSPWWARAFGPKGRFSSLLGVFCLASIAAPFFFPSPWSSTPKADTWPRALQHLFLLVNYSPLSSFAYSTIGLLAVDKAGCVGRAFNWVFALLPRKLWQEMARMSYAAYLMHAFAQVGVMWCLPLVGLAPKQILVQPTLLMAYLAVATTASYAAAAPFTYFIEARFYTSSQSKTPAKRSSAGRNATKDSTNAAPVEQSNKTARSMEALQCRTGITSATRRGAAAAAVYM